jgi:TRAP-type C4-dicarboxylate transport system substrate-binding protein
MTVHKPNRRTFIKSSAAVGAATTFGVPLLVKGAAEVTLRLASLAPEGSDWDKAFKTIRKEISERTDGRVALKMYPGGIMGSEKAMIRKIRTGQLDGAAVTSVGLAQIDKQLLVMQLPFLFKDEKQLDRVREKMQPRFEKLYEAAGFRHGINGDVGRIHLFTNTPVAEPSEIKKCKMWVWSEDAVTKETAKAAGVNGVELDVPDVLPSLQTGLIDAFTASPYAAIALQWYTKATHVTNLTLAMGIGASVLSLKKWNSLDDETKQIFTDVLTENQPKLLKRIRRANTKAAATLEKKGMHVVPPQGIEKWSSIAITVRNKLTGKMFPQDLLDEIDGHIKASK